MMLKFLLCPPKRPDFHPGFAIKWGCDLEKIHSPQLLVHKMRSWVGFLLHALKIKESRYPFWILKYENPIPYSTFSNSTRMKPVITE